MGLEISQLIDGVKEPTVAYSVDEIAKWAGIPIRPRQVKTDAELDRALEWLALVCLMHCEDLLCGDDRPFEALDAPREKSSRALQTRMNLEKEIPVAKAALERRDYARVVEVLSPLREHLRPSEKKMLNLAKKRA